MSDPDAILTRFRARAAAEGFSAVGVTGPDGIGEAGKRLQEFVGLDRHGDMGWLAERLAWRSDPAALWPAARAILMLTTAYAPDRDPLALLGDRRRGVISAYAARRDYHDVVKKRLKSLGRWLVAETGCEIKVFVDTAPVMEKPLAEAAGLGWQGKHTNLVSRSDGSWTFLGAIFTTLELAASPASGGGCGNCRKCLDICPTNAFPAPYQLDANRCIAYLSVEHRGPIPTAFRAAIGNRIFGCDDCLAVCPWNKFAEQAHEGKLALRPELQNPALAELLALDDAGFRRQFAATPVKRLGRARFLRNVLIAAGNAAGTETEAEDVAGLVAPVARLLSDPESLVRGAAVWALAQLDGERARAARTRLAEAESDPEVRREWAAVN